LGYPALPKILIVSSVSLSLSLYLSVSLSLPSIYHKPNLKICLPADLLSLSLSLFLSPSLFSDKKFPAVEAHFWLDELF
jgi:hypothetical protein